MALFDPLSSELITTATAESSFPEVTTQHDEGVEIPSQLQNYTGFPSFTLDGNKGRTITDDFELGEQIGEGGYGEVRVCVDRNTNEQFAVKIVSKQTPHWERELEMLDLVSQAQITYGISELWGLLNTKATYHSANEVHIVTERYKGPDIHDFLVEKGTFSEKQSLLLMERMLRCVEACHRAGFAHLDVKLENFIFQPVSRQSDGQKDMKVVLIDYGSAEEFRQAVYAERGSQYRVDKDDEVEVSRITGTSCYISPEIWEGRFSSRSDVWSAGVMFYTMLCGERPYDFSNKASLKESETANFQQEEFRIVSDETIALVKNMMEKDSHKRFSATEALEAISFLRRRLREAKEK
eukprot:g2254.t1